MSTKALPKCQAPAGHSVFTVPQPHATCQVSSTPTHSAEKEIKARKAEALAGGTGAWSVIPGLSAPKSYHPSHRGWVRSRAEGGTHLAQIVEVVLVVDPAVVGGHAVGAVGDVAGVYAQTVVELALEELGAGTRVTGLVTILPVLPGGGGGSANQKRAPPLGVTSSLYGLSQPLHPTVSPSPPAGSGAARIPSHE